VQQRVVGLVVGARHHQRQVGLAQDRRAEHLVAACDAAFGQRQDVEVDDVEQARGEGCRSHGSP